MRNDLNTNIHVNFALKYFTKPEIVSEIDYSMTPMGALSIV